MKAHKYWSIGALITMICTFLTGHMNKMVHAGFGLIALLCMIMSIYSGHKMTLRKNQIFVSSAIVTGFFLIVRLKILYVTNDTICNSDSDYKYMLLRYNLFGYCIRNGG